MKLIEVFVVKDSDGLFITPRLRGDFIPVPRREVVEADNDVG
jgi:hypothetical protein